LKHFDNVFGFVTQKSVCLRLIIGVCDRVLRITEINESSQLYELKNKWNEVLKNSEDNNVFLTWEFLSTYWKHFGKGKQLKVLLIEDDKGIVGVAPLRQSRYNFGNIVGYNVIEPLAYGGADYTGLIFSVDKSKECLDSVLNHLVHHGNWNFVYLYDLPENTSLKKLLPAESTKSIPKFDFSLGRKCPYLPLPNSKEVFLASLDSKLKKDMRRCLKNLERDHGEVELKRYDQLGSIENAMEHFFRLHQKRWNSKFMAGVFNTQEIRDFYIDTANQLISKGWFALYFLTVKGKPIAAQYCIEYGQKMNYVLGGFDVEFAEYSIGNLLTLKIVEYCIDKNLIEFDFLKGEESYKFRWTNQYRTNFGIRFINRNFTSSFIDRSLGLIKQTRVDRLFKKHLNI
jgi:CelD/BcsL family acetyltransferase involved in cellulose biosynthesis